MQTAFKGIVTKVKFAHNDWCHQFFTMFSKPIIIIFLRYNIFPHMFSKQMTKNYVTVSGKWLKQETVKDGKAWLSAIWPWKLTTQGQGQSNHRNQ